MQKKKTEDADKILEKIREILQTNAMIPEHGGLIADAGPPRDQPGPWPQSGMPLFAPVWPQPGG